MRTVFRAYGSRFYFVSYNLQEPPHVHVGRGGTAAEFRLERCQLARKDGFPPHEPGDVLRLARTRWGELLEAWHNHFGTARDG